MSATAVAARPSQALRQRRESQRPGLARASAAKANTADSGFAKEDMNRYVWTQEAILAKFKGCPPSLRIHLHKNHFRINESQDSLSYASPMKELIQHIRDKTVPHNMLEEMYLQNIPFYDNCMIVEVHDHKSGGTETKKESSSSADGGRVPFSIHNYNHWITPSPYAPFPQKAIAKSANQKDKAPGPHDDQDAGKENMQAPGQSASSQNNPSKPKITTVVLFPTPQQQLVDLQLLATTEAPDMQTYRRGQAAGRNGLPATPLSAVPPTPTFPTGRSPKRRKMLIDETNHHEFESELLAQQCPKLYLEPTRNLTESRALIDAITHPNNNNPPPARKSRKRTTAELAADEAEAQDMERFMLAGDEGQKDKTAASAGGEEGQPAARGANYGTFSRFKTLESIKTIHEENERRKKDEHAMEAQAKRQQAAEQEAKKRREQQEASRQEQMQAMNRQRQQLLDRQAQQEQLQQDQARAANQAQQMAGAGTAQQTPQSSQPQYSSPVPRQQTPMAAAASPLVQAQASHPMGGTPMVATPSNHGAGSPARPPSVVSQHAAAMARSVSQQQNQPMSRTGTPQMVQNTPVMNSVGPARNMAATPQPRINQGSPPGPIQGGTPIMMHTPQAHGVQGMTPEHMQHMAQAQMQQQALRRQMQQQSTQMPPGQATSVQGMAMMRARNFIQTNGVPQGQDPQKYMHQVAQNFYQQLQQQQQATGRQMNGISPQTPGSIAGQQAGMLTGQGGMNVNMPANLQLLQQSIHSLRGQHAKAKQTLITNYGSPQNAPPQHVQQIQGIERMIIQKEQEARQMMQAANMGAGGAQNPTAQYQAALHQQRAFQARQQQANLVQIQRQQSMNMNQMPQNMMGNMPMMNNMGNMGMNNMNMRPGNMNNMNMAGMQNMGTNMGGQVPMNQQQMMLMQQQLRAQQQQSQSQGNGGGMDWGGGAS